MGERDGVSKVKKALPRRLSRPGEVTGDRTRRRGAGASGEVSQGLTRRYRVEHGQASGGRAGIGRLGVLQVLYRQTGCSVSVLHRRAEGWRSVSRDELIHGSAGLGCGSWLDDDTGTGRARTATTPQRHGTRADGCCYCWQWPIILLPLHHGPIHPVARRCSTTTDGAAICLFHLQVEFELLARREQLRIATTTLTILPCFSDELD